MRKYIALVLVLVVLMVSYALAQTPRDNADVRDLGNVYPKSEGLTTFTNVAVTGLDATGVPGYIEMISSSGRIFYLYVDDGGWLRIASPALVATSASPNVTDWNNLGDKVGSQS